MPFARPMAGPLARELAGGPLPGESEPTPARRQRAEPRWSSTGADSSRHLQKQVFPTGATDCLRIAKQSRHLYSRAILARRAWRSRAEKTTWPAVAMLFTAVHKIRIRRIIRRTRHDERRRNRR